MPVNTIPTDSATVIAAAVDAYEAAVEALTPVETPEFRDAAGNVLMQLQPDGSLRMFNVSGTPITVSGDLLAEFANWVDALFADLVV